MIKNTHKFPEFQYAYGSRSENGEPSYTLVFEDKSETAEQALTDNDAVGPFVATYQLVSVERVVKQGYRYAKDKNGK